MKRTIEERLQRALNKNPITRDRLFIKILKPSIEKCVSILLQKNKRRTRLHDIDDLIQEANITVLSVIQKQDMNLIRCELRTYLLGAVKRRIWGIIRRESAIKRKAQNRAFSLDKLVTLHRVPRGIKLKSENLNDTLSIAYELQDAISKIENKLKQPALEVFQDIVNGHTVQDIATQRNIPVGTVYTLLRRKIRPLAKKIFGVE